MTMTARERIEQARDEGRKQFAQAAEKKAARIEVLGRAMAESTSWIARVNAGLKKRADGEREIAAALKERLDQVGEAAWLQQCEDEWGWSRATAYRHLNPEKMEASRATAKAQREAAKVSTVETSEPDLLPAHFTANRNPAPRKDGKPDRRFLVNVMKDQAPDKVITVAVSETGVVQPADDCERQAAQDARQAKAREMVEAGYAALVAQEGDSTRLRLVRDELCQLAKRVS